jgi:hypothetical protein
MLSRRTSLRSSLVSAGTVAFGTGFWRNALAASEVTGPFRRSRPAPRTPGAPIGLTVPRRARLEAFLRKGLPIALTLDAAATVHLKLTATRGGRTTTLARERVKVERGMERLRLRPTRALRRRLASGRGGLRAQLEVRVVPPGAPDRVLLRTIRLRPKPRKR